MLGLALLLAALPIVSWLTLRWWSRRSAAASAVTRALGKRDAIAFFHPYAHAGGGGERVLWCAINATQERHPELQCVVYTGDTGVPPSDFLALAESRFGVKLKGESIHFVYLTSRKWVDAAMWPRFTLLGQSLGSLVLGWEALCQVRPQIFVDTMGYAFTLPLFKLMGGCRVGCYVHYPTISTDMLARVQSRDVAVCNDAAVARSRGLSMVKLVYYKLFAGLYSCAGRFAEVVMTNSSWTRGHINALWRRPQRTSTVFPPCDTAALAMLPLERSPVSGGGQLIVSLAQFRPEKNHPLQIRAFARFLEGASHRRQPGAGSERVRLVLAGGCRDAGDQARVDELHRLSAELGLRVRKDTGSEGMTDNDDWDVSFRTNIPLKEVQALLGQAVVGLHTMRDEHFGINVVEFMAAGAIPLAYDSAGPALDIVTQLRGQRTGFLATDEASYAEALQTIFSLDAGERLRITEAAREAVRERFSQKSFEKVFVDNMVTPLWHTH